MDEQVIIKGENVLRMRFRRTTKGLEVYAKAHPLLEELIKGWGTGYSENISAWGRSWQAPGVLRAYEIPESLYKQDSPVGSYSLHHLSQDLILANNLLNMSWLRLEGISGPDGVTFTVAGVYSTKQMNDIAERVKMTIRQFYMDYLLPITVHITMSTEETRG